MKNTPAAGERPATGVPHDNERGTPNHTDTKMQDPIVTALSAASGRPPEYISQMIACFMRMRLEKNSAYSAMEERTYRIPGNYLQWAMYRAHICVGLALIDAVTDAVTWFKLEHHPKLPEILDLCQGIAAHCNVVKAAEPFDFPFWLVSRDMIELLARTDTLADPNIDSEAAPPFPGVHFILPKGAVPLSNGDSLSMLGVGVLSIEDVRRHGFDTPEEAKGRRLYVVGHTDGGFCLFAKLAIDESGRVSDPSNESFTLYLTTSDGIGISQDEDEVRRGRVDMNLISGWATRFLLAMNAEPGIVEAGVLDKRRKARHGKRALEFWHPRWLGRKVRILRLPVASRVHGTHRSPHTHWRRGHFARRHHGPGRALTKVVHIKPVLVNAP